MRAVALVLAALLFAALLFPLPARADPRAEQRAQIVQVIERQLDAFKKDDGKLAFSFASPNIQTQFRSPEIFMQMVISGYPPVYRPKSVTFLELVEDDGRLIQRATIVGADGDAFMALYPMMRMPDGSWRIDGCALVPLPKI
ncbi:MAG: DUF4864 domain-containing protein [Rhodospirillales bacterium]|nr:DUF4864 domain-containing protein [Rhodospirillales bacterium]